MGGLELVGLRKDWPNLRVRADLAAPGGRITALVGPSGCGKSTILRMVAGLTTPDTGRILVDDQDIGDLPPQERRIGLVFQDLALFPHLNVLGNVAYGLAARGQRRAGREASARQMLQAVGLAGLERRLPHTLSGGERQRVALARTLVTQPRVLLFDEPLSALDPELRRRLRGEIREQQRRLGLTALYVTHDLDDALALADFVAVMVGGRILQHATPQELWSRPASARVAAFLGNGPALPVLALETGGGGLVARTALGRAGLATGTLPEPTGRPPDSCARRLFFSRRAARPAHAGAMSPGGLGLDFVASCQEADFLGDSVSCRLLAGGQSLSLRFDRHDAPAPGESRAFHVPAEELYLVPDDLADAPVA